MQISRADICALRRDAGGVHQVPPPAQLDAMLGGEGTAYLATRWLAAAGPSSLAAVPSHECRDRDPSDLTSYYLDGPFGCSPRHLYGYCHNDSAPAACNIEANLASSVSPFLGPLATGAPRATRTAALAVTLTVSPTVTLSVTPTLTLTTLTLTPSQVSARPPCTPT